MNKKRSFNLWVEEDLIEKIKKLQLNSSVLFTEAAEEKLKELEGIDLVEMEENEEDS